LEFHSNARLWPIPPSEQPVIKTDLRDMIVKFEDVNYRQRKKRWFLPILAVHVPEAVGCVIIKKIRVTDYTFDFEL
jgi:hypothetical protein